jgi:small nuclear ribonucleoprotein (snRNP)-like protein
MDMMNKQDLIADIRASDEIMNLILDDEFAIELYCALTNKLWFKMGVDEEEYLMNKLKYHTIKPCDAWTASFRKVAEIVADLRNPFLEIAGLPQEDYLTWYLSSVTINGVIHNTGYVGTRVGKLLNNIGWYAFDYPMD